MATAKKKKNSPKEKKKLSKNKIQYHQMQYKYAFAKDVICETYTTLKDNSLSSNGSLPGI